MLALPSMCRARLLGRVCAKMPVVGIHSSPPSPILVPPDPHHTTPHHHTTTLRSMGQLNKKFPLEFKAYEACLDMNDFRAGDCRATEVVCLLSTALSTPLLNSLDGALCTALSIRSPHAIFMHPLYHPVVPALTSHHHTAPAPSPLFHSPPSS